MALEVGFHFQDDSYTGPQIGAATFLDVGGWGSAQHARQRMCRPYFTGRPDPVGVAQTANEWAARGCRVVLGNEPNLPAEGFGGGPAEYAAWFLDAANVAWVGTRLYYAGMSPSGDWRSWYTHPLARSAIARAAGLCIHAYGELAQMEEIVGWIHEQYPTKPLWLSEFNWGAGRRIDDPDAWVRATVPPFLDWLAAVPQVEAACWFSWRWDQSPTLPSSIDGAGTDVERVLREWTPPIPDPAPVEGGQYVKRCYIHQFDQLGERSVPEIAATLRLGGVTEVACKTHQELTWLGNATNGDTSPLAFRSLGDVQRRYAEFKAEGIAMVPWCVPMGTQVAAEARRAYDVAAACAGTVELDIEPYPGFWEGAYDGLTPYLEGIVNRGAWYEVNFDARESGWRPFGAAPFALACARAAAVWTQSYWTTFQRDAEVVVAESLATLALLEVPPEQAGIIYPWDGAADYERVTRRLHAQVPLVGRIGMWKMGPAGLDVYTALAAIPTSQAPAPGFDVAAARDRLWAEAEELAAAGYPWFSQGIKAAVAQNKGDR